MTIGVPTVSGISPMISMHFQLEVLVEKSVEVRVLSTAP